MLKKLSNKELVAAGHKFAANISADTPLLDMAKMVSELATQLDVALAAAAEACKQRDQLALENVALKNGIGFFSYGTDSGFEEHESAEKAIAAADSDIDYYRGDACDGWSEETDCTVWGVILQRATMIDERPRTEEDSYLGSHISSVCDYALLPNLATPATDAYLNAVRAEGVEKWIASRNGAWNGTTKQAQQFAAQLRAGNAGKDGSHE
ncbi:hypothetical protein [Pantoea dispersa]|uniref:hypothetical protein n=1 Tax=Pantoea dispersa TaxID=59814 RepID=UPI001239A436|nr:hypothetical protein [Pantoea dispersa]KAA8667408.1 hypothetical protein F4W08_22300 [Pantoea dispersa]